MIKQPSVTRMPVIKLCLAIAATIKSAYVGKTNIKNANTKAMDIKGCRSGFLVFMCL